MVALPTSIYAANVPNLSLVLATLAILVLSDSLHCGHIESSCIMLVYFGFIKLCQKSYSDSQDLPGISRHLSLLPVESHLFDF